LIVGRARTQSVSVSARSPPQRARAAATERLNRIKQQESRGAGSPVGSAAGGAHLTPARVEHSKSGAQAELKTGRSGKGFWPFGGTVRDRKNAGGESRSKGSGSSSKQIGEPETPAGTGGSVLTMRL
jgi:hypothetical protein